MANLYRLQDVVADTYYAPVPYNTDGAAIRAVLEQLPQIKLPQSDVRLWRVGKMSDSSPDVECISPVVVPFGDYRIEDKMS